MQLFEGYEAKIEETNNLLKSSVIAQVDRSLLEAMRRSQEHTNETAKAIREDTDAIIRRLGQNL